MPQSSDDHLFDAAIIGGGPAGLTASLYLSRFLRSVVLLDAGDARAKLIPRTHNCPGFPEGISGKELLGRLRDQAKAYGAEIVEGSVGAVRRCEGFFMIATKWGGTIKASYVILATGVLDKAPNIVGLHEGIANGSVRLCPVCDAYEAKRKRIGVLGPERRALKEALFLKDYSPHVSMLFNDRQDVGEKTRSKAAMAGIDICDNVDNVTRRDTGFDVACGSANRELDVIYLAMGCEVQSELAMMMGADCDDEGYVVVSPHLATSVPGLYAIGDVAKALNQIAVGFGHAALAATHIHNELRERRSV
ncbi:MAG TPA: NAD(P)/FAD-dependent oxidoreductase [Rhizobiaceae bacterium]|nr:NAD(P)/FAD-dependent oxidoreductase [Rhizobiaceae bacterium]